MLALVAVGVFACGRGGSAPPPDPTGPGSPLWYATRMPLAIEYVRTLPDEWLGKPLAGIPLSDGKRWLEGFVYEGVVRVNHPGMNVVELTAPDGTGMTLVWIDEGGESWLLPGCGTGDGGSKVGVRARTISGEVYTWKSLRPGAGLVAVECPPAVWAAPGSSGNAS